MSFVDVKSFHESHTLLLISYLYIYKMHALVEYLHFILGKNGNLVLHKE